MLNPTIPHNNHENHEKTKITFHGGHKNYETLRISWENNEIMKMLGFDKRIMQIMAIVEFH